MRFRINVAQVPLKLILGVTLGWAFRNFKTFNLRPSCLIVSEHYIGLVLYFHHKQTYQLFTGHLNDNLIEKMTPYSKFTSTNYKNVDYSLHVVRLDSVLCNFDHDFSYVLLWCQVFVRLRRFPKGEDFIDNRFQLRNAEEMVHRFESEGELSALAVLSTIKSFVLTAFWNRRGCHADKRPLWGIGVAGQELGRPFYRSVEVLLQLCHEFDIILPARGTQ